MFDELKRINSRPEPFALYTAKDLWTDEHTSKKMLEYHLDENVDVSSRNPGFIERSVDWICSRFKVEEGTKVADFGCGPGLYASRLARRGAVVTGIDFSKRSIEYAMEAAGDEGLDIRYVNRDYLEFETDERFDLILMIMCDFCALSPAQRRTMLGKFHSFLAPGGRVLLDVFSLNAFEKRKELASYEANALDGFWSANEYYCFANLFKYEDEKVALDKYTIVEAERTRVIYNWLAYFSRDAIEREFAECGFAVKDVFGDVAGAPFDSTGDVFAVVARKA